MNDFSGKSIRDNCPFCDTHSPIYTHLLKETKNFIVACDNNPITQGHLLIIPKAHISCVGAYPAEIVDEFLKLYSEFSQFVKLTYGSVSTFEHGNISQTIFHSHVHLFPFTGTSGDIVPEGDAFMKRINSLQELRSLYEKDGNYLFFSINGDMWVMDTQLAVPRVLRDRFAKALGNPNRCDWKEMVKDKDLMEKVNEEIMKVEKDWKEYQDRSK